MSGFLELFSQYDVLGAFLVNIELTLWSALFSLILGVILVVMRISPISSLRAVAGAYVELFKNLPLTIIMVFMVLGAYAQLKLSFSDTFATNFFWLAVTGLSLYTAAFVCESLRSGINTVPIGQAEAARALGLGFMQSATEIILPQAFRGSVAPLGNTLIALLKNSTVAAAASVATETSSLMSKMIEFRPDVIIQIFLIFALGYVILIIPIGMLTTYLSNKLAVRRCRIWPILRIPCCSTRQVPRAGAPFASSTGSRAFCSRWCSCLSSCACTTRRMARISSAGSCGSPPSNVKRGPISTCPDCG